MIDLLQGIIMTALMASSAKDVRSQIKITRSEALSSHAKNQVTVSVIPAIFSVTNKNIFKKFTIKVQPLIL